jgi:CPA1 family monovalent cation:H+ antiporter
VNVLELLVVLLLSAVVLASAARKLRIPYPIGLVLGGIALSFVPELPRVSLDPDSLLAACLPPVLYQAALNTSWRDFRRLIRPIATLATGLVAATTIGIGIVAHWLFPELPWAAAFVLGAILSPPDAVAATAILTRLNMPRDLVTVLEGESLVNDASGLVIYKLAIAAAATGVFSLGQAAFDFSWVAAAGVAVGIALGYLSAMLQKRISDTFIEMLLALALPYTAYLIAERVGVSGVLAVVSLGLVRAHLLSAITAPETRLFLSNMWEAVVFVINTIIFVLIGLELRHAVTGLSSHYDTWRLAGCVAVLTATAIAVRMLWVFPSAFIGRLLNRWLPGSHMPPSARELIVAGWCGMRGIVSVAVALALPAHLEAGAPAAERHLLLFLAFGVIACTLILQGLTLAPLIRRFGIQTDARGQYEERAVRTKMAHAALATIDRIAAEQPIPESYVAYLRALYGTRLTRWNPGAEDGGDGQWSEQTARLRMNALNAERLALLRLWRDNQVRDDLMRMLERELDLEQARLKQALQVATEQD